MLFLYLSIFFLCKRRWRSASITYSLALGVKMNALLYLPGFCVVLFTARGAYRTIGHLVLMAVVQFLLGLPFIAHEPNAYVASAFNFSRAFLFKWTVNWRFLGLSIFSDPMTAKVLLTLHFLVLVLFGLFRWTRLSRSFSWLTDHWKRGGPPPSARFIVVTLATSNLIGMSFARSLHYQFYSWYAHQLPLLAWASALWWPLKVVVPVTIEWAWNVFPSTPVSSLLLSTAHALLLLGLFARRAQIN